MRGRWIAALAALLGWLLWASQSWAQTPQPEPLQQTQQIGDLTIRVTTSPTLGDQGVIVHITTAQGAPLAAGTVQLENIMRDMTMATTPITMVQAGPGRYDGRISLSMEGRWELQVTVERPGLDPVVAVFPLTAVRGEPLPPRPATTSVSPTFWSGWAIAGLNGLLIAGVLAALNRWALAAPSPVLRRSAQGLVAVSLILCVVPYAVARATMPAVVSAAEARERGQNLFASNCVPCHGAAGKGDGPAGRTLNPRPADLTAAHVAVHPDSQIYSWIQGGVPGSAMPAFDRLSSDEIWWLVDQVRSLRP